MERSRESLMFSWNPLHVKQALKRGADINTQQGTCTPLLNALSEGFSEVAKFLIQSGADVNGVRILRDGHIRSPLVKCLKNLKQWNCQWNSHYEWFDILKMLLERGANPNQAETECGYTPLTKALSEGDVNITVTKTLIEYGADVNLEDKRGRLPLEMTIRSQNLEQIKLLLDEGAEFSIQKVFFQAIEVEDLEIIQLLIERGVRVNLPSITGKIPLCYALEVGNPEIIQLLLDRGADVNLIPDVSVDAHLNEAIKLGEMKIVKLLCQKGIDLGRKFPVKIAMDVKNLFILKYLIEMGADFNVIGRNGRTPLTTAVEERDFGLVKLLLDRGAEINQVDDAQKTAFSLAVATKNLRFAKYLEERGATIDCVSEIKEIANKDNDWKINFENLL